MTFFERTSDWWRAADSEQRARVVKIAIGGALLLATAALLVRAYHAAQPARQPEVFARLAVEDVEGVRRLVKADAGVVRQRDFEGNTPLHVAVQIGSEPLVRDLLAAGADPVARNKLGRTPLAETVEGRRPQSAIASALLAAGADAAATLPTGETALHLAVTTPGADPALAPLLARHRPAALTAVDASGRTPVQVAEALGRTRVVAALRQVTSSKAPRAAAAAVN